MRGQVIGQTVGPELTAVTEAEVPNASGICAAGPGCAGPGKRCTDTIQTWVDATEGRSTGAKTAVASGKPSQDGSNSKIDAITLYSSCAVKVT